MIIIKNIEKSFGKLKVLQKISAEVKPSKITAVLGPNGSGKTTLIKSMLGMVIPDRGEIIINEQPVKNNWKYRSMINYIPQINTFPENLTINDVMKLLTNVRNQKGHPEYFIDAFELEGFLNKRIKHLSGGTKQKANIMLACMFDNEVIIMDEPTSGLDPVAMIRLKEFIRLKKKDGRTILFTTHIMSLVEEIADEIIFLLEGEIYYQGNLSMLNAMCESNNLEQSIAYILRKSDLKQQPIKPIQNHVKSLAIQHI